MTELLEKLLAELTIPDGQLWVTLEELRKVAEKLDVNKN